MGSQLLLFIFYLLCAVLSISYHSLLPGIRLTTSDEIISTLGFFKLSLNSNDCSLLFWRWEDPTQSYIQNQVKYVGNQQGSCQWLTVSSNKIVTNTGATFLSLTANNTIKTYLMVDDTGVMRLIGIKSSAVGLPSTDFQEVKFTNNSISNQYLIMLDSFRTVSQIVPNPITNANSWIFYFSTTELAISRSSNFYPFKISTTLFSQSGIFDSQNETFPYTVFDGLIYSNTCRGSKQALVGPFTLRINQYWPIATIYDQEGYKVFQYSADSTIGYNPCPVGLFQLNRDCLTTCPSPYYHHLEGNKGQCVLNCQSNSLYDNKTRTCYCPNTPQITYQFSCVNSTSYPLGCFCRNNTFLNRSTQRCVQNCSNGAVGYAGLCVNCGQGCLTCAVSTSGTNAIICSQCQSGYILNGGVCGLSCQTNCRVCNGSTCLACNPLYALLNNFCVSQCPTGTKISTNANLSSTCVTTNLTISSCPPSCIQCSNSSICLVCKPGYTLLVSLPSTSCIRQTLLFSCSSSAYTLQSNVCYSTQASAISTTNKCQGNIANCLICLYQSTSICLLCQSGFFLQDNSCVSSCSQGYYQLNQACIKGISQCKSNTFKQSYIKTTLNINGVTQNSIYQAYNKNDLLGEPYGYQLFARRYYSFSNNVTDSPALAFWSEQICAQCNHGYGLSADEKSCQPCPSGCLLCLYAYDNSCIATTQRELSLYSLDQVLSACQGFIAVNQSCIPSCPVGTIPTFNSTLNKLSCLPISLQSQVIQTNYVKVEGCSFQQSSQKYIHKFVFSQPLQNHNLTTARLLQTTNTATVSADGSAIIIESSQPSAVLNLSGVVQNYVSVNGNYPAATVYGVSSNTSFRAYLGRDYVWIGYIFSLIILATHCVYVGSNYMYKMDNLIVFCQAIFYFLFVRILSSNPVAQFYYGWNWLHLLFYPNYFSLEGTASSAPPYVMFNLDANFIRNAGSSLSFLLTFFFLWLIISTTCYLLDSKFGRHEIWFYSICRNSLCAGVELVSFNIFYWAVAYSFYDQDGNSNDTFAGVTALCIIGVIAYTIIRTYFDRTACLYMIKRIVYASLLASSYQRLYYVVILVIFEVIFLLVRYFTEKPAERNQKIYLIAEQAAIILGLVLLYIVQDVIAIAMLISLMVYMWYLTLVVDLVDIYLRAKNKFIGANWLPCLGGNHKILDHESSKDEIRDEGVSPGTNRPLSSEATQK